MIQVNLARCTGCGKCFAYCPVEAISLVANQAVIDADTCLNCGACVPVCPAGAIEQVGLAVLTPAAAIQPTQLQTIAPVPSGRVEKCLAWAAPVLSAIGREMIVSAVDALAAAIERRASFPVHNQSLARDAHTPPRNTQRRVRQRQRNRNLK